MIYWRDSKKASEDKNKIPAEFSSCWRGRKWSTVSKAWKEGKQRGMLPSSGDMMGSLWVFRLSHRCCLSIALQ